MTRSWIDNKVDVFLAEAHPLGLTAPRAGVATLIERSVERAALLTGVTARTARQGFTDDHVRDLVRTAAEDLAAEVPGTQLDDLPATHTVPVALAARTTAGLAIVTELVASAAGPDRDDLLAGLRQSLSLITTWGALIEGATAARSAPSPTGAEKVIEAPEALLHRSIRELERGRTALAGGTVPRDGGDPIGLAAALGSNAEDLTAEL
ncbi:hypothetical protein [Rhodococcus sovatensis]|uniref:DUF222 domain-containing protein n=1 Tax=Rhodococcus sovatensis TaxID=1805840 RepID=A0ABZ2PLV5_9NOCA